ncbi:MULTISPECIES: prephenate dehydrogenase [unclassified Leucobacter]|uniref:prephenate dehydrogenase n=1 Tax=unclassified Leucobacter TaxID=2621730 RepID=UPI00165E3CA4|nr:MULTISPECIES: prephenate dehydrogenase [unclassified Leucobacter]MBC9928585.1 prephenate dehydrogenase [Leucobacter sp. cx-169]MBC9936042.1 prephenate dehydrogenase [Leucobacter sp. cx-87]
MSVLGFSNNIDGGSSAVAGDARVSRVAGPVHIVGAGLLGASVGLALTERGVDVTLDDASPTALALAIDYGAGRARVAGDPDPQLVVVATPPDVTADAVQGALAAFPTSVVTDVASVKLAPFVELTRRGVDLTNYIGSHPMAGRERGGAIMARTDLFVARPWVICRDGETPAAALAIVEALALELGASPLEMTPEEHDRSVGLVSHLPQIVSSLLAARLLHADDAAVGLAGQGLRDTTRIAASQPELWVQILGANRAPVVELLEAFQRDVSALTEALRGADQPGSKRQIADLLAAGNRGVARIPGKHGRTERFVTLTVLVDDRPGELARLLTELGELGINMEDLRLEHSPGAQIGFAEIAVLPEVADRAAKDLSDRGWRTL